MNLYFLMAALFMALALLGAVDASLTSFTLLPFFNGLRWLRVHLITLGAMTEALFGLLPALVAIRFGLSRPKFRWDIWLTLNAGLLTLLIGIPIINQALIFTGGTLIFVATILLMGQLNGSLEHRTFRPQILHCRLRLFFVRYPCGYRSMAGLERALVDSGAC